MSDQRQVIYREDGSRTFAPGNQLNLVHGANSPREIAKEARKVHDEILAVAPWIDHPHFLPSVKRYLDAAAVEQLLHYHVMKTAMEQGPAAVPGRLWENLTAARRLAAKLATDLGLDPIGYANLKAVTVDTEHSVQALADLRAQGDAILRAREMVEGTVEDDDD